MTMRASSPDRRVWLMESTDTSDWADPILILHGDPADPPSVQLYGMPYSNLNHRVIIEYHEVRNG